MAEDFALSELVIPGAYIRVRAEGLIGVAGISSGNVGVVGTAAQGSGDTQTLSDYQTGQSVFGPYNAGQANLTRALEQLYGNGAATAYARALDPAHAQKDDYLAAFHELLKDDVNILVAPELKTDDAKAVFGPILTEAENNGKDVIAVIGSDADTVSAIKAQVTASDRMILTAPGFLAYDVAAKADAALPGTFTAAAVAGLLSTLTPQSSPTNKVVPGVVKLARRFAYGETKDLISGGVLVLEERQGVRVVRGVTTEMATNGPFRQITTRRIVDFAKAGIRQASTPFIGRLNNARVRKALQGAINGFLTTMVQDEALTGYGLEVTATRDDEIAGRAMVNAVLQPTFSIDFVAVTLVLQ
jgi:hypothetical protein